MDEWKDGWMRNFQRASMVIEGIAIAFASVMVDERYREVLE